MNRKIKSMSELSNSKKNTAISVCFLFKAFHRFITHKFIIGLLQYNLQTIQSNPVKVYNSMFIDIFKESLRNHNPFHSFL